MKHTVIIGSTFAELYNNIVYAVMNEPHYETAPRGQAIRELVSAKCILKDPTSNLFINAARSVPKRYLAGELLWYFMGTDDLSFIQRFSKFWDGIANDDGTVNSAYGYLIFNEKNEHHISQWQWAYDSLVKDKDSRQAILHFNRPRHQRPGVKDFVCTLTGIFHIRDNRLNFEIDMRSNDVFFGLTYDLPFFSLLQQLMVLHLKPHYPDLKIGTYIHNAKSLHAYERDFSTLNAMMTNVYKSAALPLMEFPLVEPSGKPSSELIAAFHDVYDGDDQLLNWMQNTAFPLKGDK